jgi:DNA-binding FadR family transcriptional regulator
MGDHTATWRGYELLDPKDRLSWLPDLARDPFPPRPLYVQVAEQLYRAIGDGILRQGERMPACEAIGARFFCSKPTARASLHYMARAGVLELRPGGKYYIKGVLAPRGRTPETL